MEDRPVKFWRVLLAGDKLDLSTWRQLYWWCPDPRLEIEGEGGDAKLYLRSSRFANLIDRDEVLDAAEHIVDLMNGCAMLAYDGRRVAISKIAAVFDGGEDKEYPPQRRPAFLHLRAGVPSRKDGGPPAEPSHSQSVLLRSLSRAPTKMLDALVHFSRADNWFDLWKTFEVVEHDLSRRGKPQGREMMRDLGWATKADIDRFALTAQHYRHAEVSPPSRVMSFVEAKEWLRSLLDRWIADLATP